MIDFQSCEHRKRRQERDVDGNLRVYLICPDCNAAILTPKSIKDAEAKDTAKVKVIR
jgi:hypothetical protein